MKKQQYNPQILWLLRGSYDTPSSRIHGHRIHEYLLNNEWNSNLLVQPSHWLSDTPLTVGDVKELKGFRSGDIAIIQKLEGPRTIELIEYLSGLEVVTVYLDCDMPLKLKEASSVDWVVCSSKYLAEAYKTAGIDNVEHIPDAVEYFKSTERIWQNKPKFQCVWFGSNSPYRRSHVEWLRNLFSHPKLSNWELVTISKGDIADINWNLTTVWNTISRFDAVAIPAGKSLKDYAKSENRVTQAMVLKVPVVATPIPAYSSVIQNGITGFLCETEDEWIRAFKMLTERELSTKVIHKAYKYANDHYSIKVIGLKWERFFRRIAYKEVGENDLASALEVKKLQARGFARLAEIKVGKRRIKYLVKALSKNFYDYMIWHTLISIVVDKSRILLKNTGYNGFGGGE